MTDNFLDNIAYGNSTLSVSGNAIQVGDGAAGVKSIIFTNDNGALHLAANATGNVTINLPTNSGAILVSSQAILSVSAGAGVITSGQIIFSNSNGMSFGVNGQIITGSYTVPSTAGLISAINVSGGTTSNNLSALTFSNSNGISFGLNGSTLTASYSVPSTAGLISNINISAGTTSNNLSALTFSNSNGLAFGLNGSTITGSYTIPTQTNQTVGLYGLGNTTQNSSTTLDARSLSFNGLGNITVGYSNGSIQVSGSQTAQTQNIVVPSAGTQTATSGTVVFSDSNGISFGMSGSSRITASYTVPSTAGLISNINISAGTTSNNLSAITFSNSNGLAFGLNGSTITGSYTVPTQSNQTAGLYALGNTTQNSSTTLDVRSLSFNGLGNITVGYSNGSIQVSGSQSVQTQSLIQAIYDGANSITTGTIRFSNSNGISFGINGQTVTASHNGITSQTNQTIGLYAAGNTTGQSSSSTVDARSLTFSGSGNISVGYSNGSVIIAQTGGGAQSNQTVGLYALGNTTQNSSTTLDARSLSFNGLGDITVGYSNGSIQVSGSQTVQTSNIVVPSAGTQTATSGTVVFSNSNGISFGMSGSSRITASYTVPSTAGLISNINISAGTTSNNLSALTFSNSNGLAFGLNGSTITGSYTVPSIAGLISAINVSGGTTSNNLSALTFSNSNNVSFGLNGSTMTASASFPAQTNQTLGLYAVSNTTGQSSSSTFDARSLSFQGAGIASVGYSNGSVVVSVPSGGGGLTNINISAGTTSNNLSALTFSNANGVSFGLNGSTLTASVNAGGGGGTLGLYAVGNTTQNSSTTLNQNTVSFNALGAMTMGYSNGSIQVSAPATSNLTATGGIILSTNDSTISIGLVAARYFEPYLILSNNTISITQGQGSLYFMPFVASLPINSGRINIINAYANALSASTTNFATNTTGSRALTYQYSKTLALYSQGTGTNSTRLESMWSNTWTMGLTQTVSVSSAAGTTIRATNAISLAYIASVDINGVYTTTSTSASQSASAGTTSLGTTAVSSGLSTLVNMITGTVIIPIGFNTSISAGNYWMMQGQSLASTTAGTTANSYAFSFLQGITGLSTEARLFGKTAPNSTSQMRVGQGVFSAASASPPSTIAISNIRSVASNPIYYFNIIQSNA